jgi:glycosyltransferase involved in cell wall biosynthesis
MGDGPELIPLKNRTKELNISKYFLFHGFITDDIKKQDIYTSADIMIFPSHREGFPYTILEAMLFSMPIISTHVGALKDIIIENENGFLINPQNSNELFEKMRYFILHPNKINKMGKNSFDLVNNKYSILQMQTMLNNLYKEVLL